MKYTNSISYKVLDFLWPKSGIYWLGFIVAEDIRNLTLSWLNEVYINDQSFTQIFRFDKNFVRKLRVVLGGFLILNSD